MPAMGYLTFAWHNRRFLGFGFLMTFFASFGQTFFIGIYGGEVRAEFGLSNGEYGAFYSGATLVSALSLLWLGRRIDRIQLRQFASLVCAGLVVAMVLMGSAVGPVTLFLALFALRLTGQGLMVHTAVTSMARYFEAARGRAVSAAMLGVPAGEAVLPALAVVLTGAAGWRASWWGLALVLALGLVPTVRFLLRDHASRDAEFHRAATRSATSPSAWPLSRVIRDPRFLVVIVATSAPSFIITGIFFHHAQLALAKNWSLAWLATAFIAYAVATVPASLLAGAWVDRWRASGMLPFMMLPLAASLVTIAVWDAPVVAIIYLALAGVGAGNTAPILGALWAELYGVANLGAIRSVQTAMMVFSSALSPVVVGELLDRGTSIEAIAIAFIAYILVGSTALAITFTRRRSTEGTIT